MYAHSKATAYVTRFCDKDGDGNGYSTEAASLAFFLDAYEAIMGSWRSNRVHVMLFSLIVCVSTPTL